MPSINVHHLWSWLNPLPKMVSYFWRLFWIFAPSHKYLHLGNLNPINILKCPNNLEGIFRLLRIFSNVPLNIFRFFLNGIVFLLFQNTEQKQIKRKTESREGNLPGSPPGGPALCWPMASQLLGPARAGTEVMPACASSPRRHLLAASPVDELDDLHVAPPSPWTPPFAPITSPSLSLAMAEGAAATSPA